MTLTPIADLVVRRARVTDVRRIKQIVDVYAGPVLLEKTLANLFEDVHEFWVAESGGTVVGCGALHVLWEDLGEIRTVTTDPGLQGQGWATRCASTSSVRRERSACTGCSC